MIDCLWSPTGSGSQDLLLLPVNISPICVLVLATSHNVSFPQYTDDAQHFQLSRTITLGNAHTSGKVSKLPPVTMVCVLIWINRKHTWFQNSTAYSLFHRTPSKITLSSANVMLSDTISTSGVSLDQNLKFDSYVQTLCKSGCYYLNALYHLRPLLPEKNGYSSYFSMYSVSPWLL